MSSGPVFFKPDNASVSARPLSSSSTRTLDDASNSSFNRLEETLQAEESLYMQRYMKTSKKVGRDAASLPAWLIWGGDLGAEAGAQMIPVKSSIQASIAIDVSWHRSQQQSQVAAFFTRQSSTGANASLPVRSAVTVAVDLNLPVRGSAAAVLSLYPLRVIIAQVGALIASAIMRSLAPIFVEALVRDYEKRKILLISELYQPQ